MRRLGFYSILRLYRNVSSARLPSFSQTGEDLIIEKYFKEEVFTYIDIGAGEPIVRSNTYLFYKKGCKGILVDPLKTNKYLSKLLRPRDIFLSCLVGEKNTSRQFIEYENYEYSSMTALHQSLQGKSEPMNLKIKRLHFLQVRTLSEIASQYLNNSLPWFLSIDVEGAELEVLKSFDFKYSSPRLICIEDHEYLKYNKSDQHHYILALGYELVATTNLSLIYLLKS